MKLGFFTLGLLFSLNALAINHGLLFNKNSLKSQKTRFNVNEQTKFYAQKLDHFGGNDVTFKQRYFVDSSYAENETSPVFYIICGEWNCAGTASYGYAVNLAKKTKAHLVALEHRFYGESLPTNKLTTANLKELTLAQSVEDLAEFQKFMMKDSKLTGKWIAFGGSYAGTLAGFYRLKHPTLITGALASSAPVIMKPEFFEYDAHIAKVVNKSECGNTVRKAVALIEEKLKTEEGTAELKSTFKSTNIKLTSDFIYVVADMLAAAVQYGRDKVFCDAIMATDDVVAGYAQGGLKVLAALGITPFDLSFQSAEKVEVTADDNYRQWMWQSCTEFGWFQVANGTDVGTSRSSMVDLKYHQELCERLYQTPMRASEAMNDLWFAHLMDTDTSKIIFTNGANDPWLTLSLTEFTPTSNPELPLFMMEGAAHCSDLKAVSAIPAVIAAQVSMDGIISKWINE